MSFASNVKQELCRQPVGKKCCAVAESFGILLYCNTFTAQQIKIVTESTDLAQRLPRLFRKAFGLNFDAEPQEGERGGKLTFSITDREKIDRIFQAFDFSAESSVTLHVNYAILEEPCCQNAFLRGVFLAGGSVTDPEKRYHLELTTTHRKVGLETEALLLDLGFYPKDTERSGTCVIYFKQSDAIEDYLTFLGAPVSAMAIMEAKVEKELRNGVNRRVNCDTANLTKVVDAAQEQIAAIRRLESRGQLEQLPEKLRQTAALRVENPEATLTELAAMLDPPVTKSALNHRMRKLIELANS